MAEFDPPKPKELERTTFKSCLLLLPVTILSPHSRSGVSRFKFSGIIFFCREITEKIAYVAPAAPKRCPVNGLVELTGILCAYVPSAK